jgi:hypothetical protein
MLMEAEWEASNSTTYTWQYEVISFPHEGSIREGWVKKETEARPDGICL